jgi:hypothetical protein
VKSRLLFARGLIAASILMIFTATPSYARTPNVPPADPDPVVAALSSSQSGALSGSLSNSASKSSANSASKSNANSASKATGGNARSGSASNAKSGDSAAASDASSDNDTSVSSDDDTFIPRNTPPVFLPALIASECGSGASAGGSGTGGAGALSGLWTSKRCYALKSASIAFGIGDYEGGCKLLAYVNREAYKLVDHTPDCKAFADRLNAEAAQPVVIRDAYVAPDLTEYAKRSEMNEAIGKAFRTTIAK